MSENSPVPEGISVPSNEYFLEEIAKIKEELKHLKDLKAKTLRSTKSKPKRRAAVKRKTTAKRKPVKRRAAVKRKPSRRRK